MRAHARGSGPETGERAESEAGLGRAHVPGTAPASRASLAREHGAGAGVPTSTRSFIDLPSFSTISDMTFSRKALFSGSIGFASDGGPALVSVCEIDQRRIACTRARPGQRRGARLRGSRTKAWQRPCDRGTVRHAHCT